MRRKTPGANSGLPDRLCPKLRCGNHRSIWHWLGRESTPVGIRLTFSRMALGSQGPARSGLPSASRGIGPDSFASGFDSGSLWITDGSCKPKDACGGGSLDFCWIFCPGSSAEHAHDQTEFCHRYLHETEGRSPEFLTSKRDASFKDAPQFSRDYRPRWCGIGKSFNSHFAMTCAIS